MKGAGVGLSAATHGSGGGCDQFVTIRGRNVSVYVDPLNCDSLVFAWSGGAVDAGDVGVLLAILFP